MALQNGPVFTTSSNQSQTITLCSGCCWCWWFLSRCFSCSLLLLNKGVAEKITCSTKQKPLFILFQSCSCCYYGNTSGFAKYLDNKWSNLSAASPTSKTSQSPAGVVPQLDVWHHRSSMTELDERRSKSSTHSPLMTGTPSLSVTTMAWRPSTLKKRRQTLEMSQHEGSDTRLHHTHLCNCLYRYLFKSCKRQTGMSVRQVGSPGVSHTVG